ncbi:MAG: bifunctional 3-(3-hydroxy-phenyl)propionate/3-hydroxycinnamic acid hydroxylase [Pseudomonadota bacterium]
MTNSTPLPDHVPVLVVGAGPTGLSVSNLLAQAGVPVLIVDRAPEPLNLPRAIVLDDEGLRMLQALGLSQQVEAMTIPGEGSHYYDEANTLFAETGAGAETYGFAKRNFLFQPDLERVLRDKANGSREIDLRLGTEVLAVTQTEDVAAIELALPNGKTHEMTADWVLACDGGRSPIRQALKVSMVGDTYGQDWLVIDTHADADSSRVSKFFCSAARPHVSIPAPRGGRRYEFMVMPGEDGNALLEDDQLQAILAPFRQIGEADIIRKAIYTFHARMAAKWRDGRVFLMGDAAHLTPPFAGQGMNAGLRDAHNLAWKLALVVKGVAGPNLLDSYEEERREPAWSMIQLAVAMGQVVMPRDAAQAQLRDALVLALAPFPSARDFLIDMKFKPRPRYEKGFFLDLHNPQFEGSMVGDMAPQPVVDLDHGQSAVDELLGPGFALVAQSLEGETALAEADHPLWNALDARRLTVDLTKPLARGETRARAWRSHRDQVLLIRPDRYVAAAMNPKDLDKAAGRLQAQLHSQPEMAQAAQ